MSRLRLGVASACFNEEGDLLLSRRGDLGVWNLPTGRLDAGEAIAAAAAREVREETGIECDSVRPIGLYYQQARSRLNILFESRAQGGQLLQQTQESTANTFFARNALPPDFFGDFMARDAFDGGTHLHVLVTPPAVLRRVRRQLAWRYVKNLLTGQPEPRWVQFDVQASLVVQDRHTGLVLGLDHANERRILPGCRVNSDTAPWEQVRTYVRDHFGLYELREASLRWVGLYQSISRQAVELVFAADIAPVSAVNEAHVTWSPPASERWLEGYRAMLASLVSGRVTQVIE